MSGEPWAAIFDTAPGRVTLRFSAPLRAIGLTPQGAQRLAAKLLLLAETADRGDVGTFSAPAVGLEPCPIVDLHQEPAS
jgi:hypothetical protein